MRTPSSERLRTSKLLSKRMADRAFRESLPANSAGERHVMIADAEDRLGDVFDRIDGTGVPTSICLPLGGGGLFIIRVTEASEDHDDHQDCSPDIELGMLVELLAAKKGKSSICVTLKEPVELHLALS